MPADRDPQPGEVWEDRRGKRRLVLKVWSDFCSIPWTVVWVPSASRPGTRWQATTLTGWHRRGWRLVQEAPAGGEEASRG